jgi:hypothetical protein
VPATCVRPDILTTKIDKALGRWVGATQQRLEIAGYGSGDQVRSFRAPKYLLAERDALAGAREQQALTQLMVAKRTVGPSAATVPKPKR